MKKQVKSVERMAFEKAVRELTGAHIDTYNREVMAQYVQEWNFFLAGWYGRDARTDLSIEKYFRKATQHLVGE